MAIKIGAAVPIKCVYYFFSVICEYCYLTAVDRMHCKIKALCESLYLNTIIILYYFLGQMNKSTFNIYAFFTYILILRNFFNITNQTIL